MDIRHLNASTEAKLRELAEGDDPRFAALRGKHLTYFKVGGRWCYRCNSPTPEGYCLDTSTDALLAVAAACRVIITTDFVSDKQGWLGMFAKMTLMGTVLEILGTTTADTPNEALALALLAAVQSV